jgi:hypothetical protein
MTVVLVLIAVLVVASLVVLVLALCVAAGRADDLVQAQYALELQQREGISWSGGAPLRGARDRRRTARPSSPERRRRPRLSV